MPASAPQRPRSEPQPTAVGEALLGSLSEHVAAVVWALSRQDTHTDADRDLVALVAMLGRAVDCAGAARRWRLERTLRALGPHQTIKALGISRQRLSQLVPMGTRREMPARTPSERDRRIVRDYERGEPVVRIAKRLGMSHYTVKKVLLRHNVTLRETHKRR